MENKNQKEEDAKQIRDLLAIAGYVTEFQKEGKLTESASKKVEELWNKYKETKVTSEMAVIDAQFGLLGSLIIRSVRVSEFDGELQYRKGYYDYVSIRSENERKILWTDYSDKQPYDRQGGLYCGGATFESLGTPVVSNGTYREFDATYNGGWNTSFGVWGYSFNDFYGSIRFGMAIRKENVETFLSELRIIIGK